MVGKVKISSLIKMLIVISALIALRVDLFLVSNEQSSMNLLRYVVIVFGMFSMFLVLFCQGIKSHKSIYRFSCRYILIMTPIVLFFLIYTKNLYGYSLYQTFSLAIPFLYNYMAIGIVYVLDHESKSHKILDLILGISLLFIVIRFIAWFSYNYLPIHIFENFALEYAEWNRNGLQRVVGGCLFGLTYILANVKAMEIEDKKEGNLIKRNRKYYFIIAFLALYNWFIIQSRYACMVLLVTTFLTYFVTRRKNVSKWGIVFLVIGSTVVLSLGGIIPEFLNSFSLEGKYGLSTLARLEGIDHFFKLFRTTGKGIGLGFLTNGYGTETLFYRTSWLDYYIGDLGILGIFFRYGIFTIIIYGYLFIKAINLSKYCIKKRNQYFSIILTTTIYMILTCVMSDLYDASYAFIMPFYIAIISYVDGKCRDERRAQKDNY